MDNLDQNQTMDAFIDGRRQGLAIAALAVGLVTYLSLLGAEKAILAIVLGTMALRGARPQTLPRRLGAASIWLGSVFLVTVAAVLVIFHEQVAEFVALLQKIS